MAQPSWLSGMYGPLSSGPVPTTTPPPASLTVLAPQQGTVISPPPPPGASLVGDQRTPSVF